MAPRFILAILVAASALAQDSTNRLTLIPSPADEPGKIYFREKRANGTNKIGLRAPDALGADREYVLPSTYTAGAMCHDGSGNLTWGTCSATTTEVSIMDYGAVADCSAETNTAFAAALAALGPYGGIIKFPAGCFLITDTLTIGDGSASGASTVHSITVQGAGTSNREGMGGGTIIRWHSGSLPAGVKPIIKFAGPFHGGGIRDMTLDTNEVANVTGVQMIHQTGGYFSHITIISSRVTPTWEINTVDPVYPYGACLNTILNLNIEAGIGGGGGVLLDGSVAGRNSCSNVFINGHWWYDASNPSGYGLKLRYADNNSFIGVNFLNSSFPTGTSPGILFEQYAGDASFPKENQFSRVATHVGPAGTSGTGGNTFLEYSADDCGGTFCVPNIAYLKGMTKGDRWGSTSQPAGIVQNNNGSPGASMLQLKQTGGGVNDAGGIEFLRTGDPRAKIHADYFDGIVFSTKSGGGSLTQRWSISDAGTLFPWADNTYTIGSLTKRVAGLHAMTGDVYGALALNNGSLAIKTSGGLTRGAFDTAGFTLYSSLGAPTILAFSATGQFGASVVETATLRVTTGVDSNLIPSGTYALGNNSARWEAWLSNVSASSVAVAGSITAGSGSVSGNWSVSGTLTAGTFSPSSISTSTVLASTSATAPFHQVQHPTISQIIGTFGREPMTGFPSRYGGNLYLYYETNLGFGSVFLPYLVATPNSGLGVVGTINATSMYQINGANGYTGACAGTVVVTGGIVTNCI